MNLKDTLKPNYNKVMNGYLGDFEVDINETEFKDYKLQIVKIVFNNKINVI